MINYITGDATQPQGEGNKIIIHCCNDIGGWGSGFVLALSARWADPELSYRHWFQFKRQLVWLDVKDQDVFKQLVLFELGEASIYQVEEDIYVSNIIGQRGIIGPDNPVPVDYNAIRKGVCQVRRYANLIQASIHMPRMGCGLAGGEWSEIEKIIEEELKEINVTVYDLEGNNNESSSN